jgi:two-component system response regulator NreC
MTIRVVLVDDHAVVRSGLKMILDAEEDIDTVAEAGTMRDAIFAVRREQPDVVLMDLVMPGGSGIDATPGVLKEAPEAKVLVLSMQDDPAYVREAFAAGAMGYVLKEAADTELVAAIREVAAGGRYVDPAHRAHIMQKLRLSTRAELVRHALETGLLDAEPS